MKTFYTLAIAILPLVSCHRQSSSAPQDTANLPSPAGNASAENSVVPGRKLFIENCSECHGTDGKKHYKEAKDLSQSTLTLPQRIHVISSAQVIGNMVHKPRWNTILTEKEISEVAVYLDSLKR